MARLIAEDLLGPAQAFLGMPVLEEPAGGIVLVIQIARGPEHLVQELPDVLPFLAKPGGRFSNSGPGKRGTPQAGEHQASLIMDLRLTSVDAQCLVQNNSSPTRAGRGRLPASHDPSADVNRAG